MAKKDETSGMEYVVHAGLFIVEVVLIPYYMFEDAYYRSKNRTKKFYR
jgi:hypothetical protein